MGETAKSFEAKIKISTDIGILPDVFLSAWSRYVIHHPETSQKTLSSYLSVIMNDTFCWMLYSLRTVLISSRILSAVWDPDDSDIQLIMLSI